MKSNTIASGLLLLALISSACGQVSITTPPGTPAPAETAIPSPATASPTIPTQVSEAALPVFAAYDEPIVRVVPGMAHEPIAADLSNVRVPFLLSPGLRVRLAENGFVVAPGVEKEFFTVYEKARYDN